MKPYLFSICIPTWNRSECLNRLLKNIETQIKSDLDFQVVVSDNNSTDNTYQVVARFFDSLNIKYIRKDRNIGGIKNVSSIVSYADGIYCILIGDDDIFREGWLTLLKTLVRQYRPDVVISNRFVCDSHLNIKFSEQCGPAVQAPTLYDCSEQEVLIDYLSQTESTSGFGFISNQVIRRKCWVDSIDTDFINSHPFPHLLKIMDILAMHRGSILKVPFETVFACSGSDRLEEELGADKAMTEFDKLNVHFHGFLSAANYLFAASPKLRSALLTPIKRIFSNDYRDYYISLAASADKEAIGRDFISRLDRAIDPDSSTLNY